MEDWTRETLGSAAERVLQERYGSEKRAQAFYRNQVLDHLNPLMRDFIRRQELFFLATADSAGRCDCSFRAGSQGFVTVVNEKRLFFPEYRGNGVMASLANISVNPQAAIIFPDFFVSTVGLHVNGRASIVEAQASELARLCTPALDCESQRPQLERWVTIEVEEAYIHCSKHMPLVQRLDKRIHWGSDDETHKGGDYFRAKRSVQERRGP